MKTPKTQLTAIAVVSAFLVNAAIAQDAGPLQVKYSLSYPDGSTLKDMPSEVRIVKAEHMQRNVAGKVALGVLLFAVGGGTGFTTSSKDNLKGAAIDALDDRSNIAIPSPQGFAESLQTMVDTAIPSHENLAGKTFKKPLLVGGGMSQLVYEGLTGDDAKLYRLKTDWVVYKYKESFSLFKNPLVVVDCSQQSTSPLPQSSWAENNYAQVKVEMDASIAACKEKVLAAVPELLKD